ncbi:Calcineurin-like phosphoesterase [Chitinophaga sp. CF118]|uniref:metallophosphoesterase n=1 Tax=Chitinophaga sp. CF118 TaxID=1884367 RepID=UPI0008E4D852|nr:metallophosphoesterase [Chitinophaga sp. CF118]SFD31933.1 Calcineurin-like phosphoesterase [Chitinophaga sp. CF118]
MIMIGDLHGEHLNVLNKILQLEITNTPFIQVGDFGLGFHDLHRDIKTLAELNKFFEMHNNTLYIIRGNHDNPFFWNHRHELQFKHIVLVQDYEKITIEDQKILFIGGGISIDRKNRTPGKDYWADEEFVFNQELLNNACTTGIDMVVTHIAPDKAWPYTFTPVVNHYASREPNLKAALHQERSNMTMVYEQVKLAGCKQWYYGHYHQSKIEEKEGLLFQCLDINEMHRPSIRAVSD